MIFRLSLLIVGLLMGTTCSFSQIPSMKSIPDSILAHYSSLESRGYIAVKIDTATTVWGDTIFLSRGRDISSYPSSFREGTYYVLPKDTPEKRFAIDLIDFIKYKDSLRLEERINSFLFAVKQEKTFKKFFKAVKKRYGYDYTTDDVVKFVTAYSGQVVFPECDAEMVKSFMKTYHVEPNDFLIYFKYKKTEDYYLNHLWESPFAPKFIERCEHRDGEAVYFICRKYHGTEYGKLIGEYRKTHTRETPKGFWNSGDVDWDELKAVIDGDRFSIRLRNSRKYILDTLKNNKEFLRFLAHHFPSKNEILSDNVKDYIWISKDGREAWCYEGENVKNAFYKNADGLWTLVDRVAFNSGSFYVVFDSTVTTAMLPYITIDRQPSGANIADESEIKTSISLNDEDMNLKFSLPFKVGVWVKSGTTPQYSIYAAAGWVKLTNPVPKEDFRNGSVSNFEIAVGLDNSDPSNPKVIRNGLDLAKLKKERDKANEEMWKREYENFIKEYAPIYGLSQVKSFTNNGYKPFIGMSLAIFNGLYVDDVKSGYYRNVRVISEDSFGNAVYVYNYRWFYFYNGKLHHWVDKY